MTEKKEAEERDEPSEQVEGENPRKILLGKRLVRRMVVKTGVQTGAPSTSETLRTSRCGT